MPESEVGSPEVREIVREVARYWRQAADRARPLSVDDWELLADSAAWRCIQAALADKTYEEQHASLLHTVKWLSEYPGQIEGIVSFAWMLGYAKALLDLAEEKVII